MKSILLAALLFTGEQDFDKLMGKSTPHWRYVTAAQDIDTLSFAKTLYLENAPLAESSEGPHKIPPVVHFIWLGPKAFPPQSVENIRSWIAMHPDWKVKFWTDSDREPPCTGMEKVSVNDFTFTKLKRCYDASQNWGEKSDLLRYEILLQEGGVYVDHDANCLRSFEEMHRAFDLFCGLETPHEPFVGRNITCGNGVIGSRPNHPTIARVIDLIAERWDPLGEKYRGNDEYSKIEVVMQRTYIALTLALPTLNQGGNRDIILPAAYFFSKMGIAPLYSEHFYASAWDDYKWRKTELEKQEEKTLGKLYQKNQNLKLLLIGQVLLSSCFLGAKTFQLRRRRAQ
ncbi:MAG: hypothetical protein JSS61_03670 [Verrucomicrobia bacterium]|nr:hypothetical protein [Verrucomicrobiota bacterium]